MTKQELLIPRYEQVIDIPLGPMETIANKTVYTLNFEGREEFSLFGKIWTAVDFDKYPHAFRRMQWWEKRELSELPEYLSNHGIVYKSTGDHMLRGGTYTRCYNNDANSEHEYIYVDYRVATPATLQEYDDYINTKSK